jgi:hypothetical protein
MVTGMTSRWVWLGIGIGFGVMLSFIPISMWHGSVSAAWSRMWAWAPL